MMLLAAMISNSTIEDDLNTSKGIAGVSTPLTNKTEMRLECGRFLNKGKRALSSDWLSGMGAARSLAITRANEAANYLSKWQPFCDHPPQQRFLCSTRF